MDDEINYGSIVLIKTTTSEHIGRVVSCKDNKLTICANFYNGKAEKQLVEDFLVENCKITKLYGRA